MKISDLSIETLLDLFPINVYIFDLEDRVVWLNKQMMTAAKIQSRENVCGHKLLDVLGELNWEREMVVPVLDNNHLVIETQRSISTEEEGYFEGERQCFVSHKSPVFDPDGEVIGVIGVSYDITRKKEHERLQQEKQQLESAMRSLKTLAAVMAHELRTPLVGTKAGIGAINKFLQKLSDSHPEMESELKGLLEPVLSAMRVQLDQALMFVDLSLANFKVSKIDRSTFVTLSMKDVIQKTFEDYPFQAAERDIVFWDPNESDDFEFIGSLTLTKHVFFNLLKNAIYYARAARLGTVTVKILNDADGHRVIVRDTGQGISPEILPKIFDLFFTNRELGTGVGLSFCKMVMEEYGGEIICQSELGKFTEFILVFPEKKGM